MVLRLGGQREVVARHRSLDDVADPHVLMPFARALPLRLAQHGDAIARAFGRIVVQREIAHRPVADPHRDMRPGREPGQIALIRVHQLVAVDPLGQIGNRAHAKQHAWRLSAPPRPRRHSVGASGAPYPPRPCGRPALRRDRAPGRCRRRRGHARRAEPRSPRGGGRP